MSFDPWLNGYTPENSDHQLGCQSLSHVAAQGHSEGLDNGTCSCLAKTDELSAGGSSGGTVRPEGDRGAALRSRNTSRRLPTRVWHNGEWRHRSSPLSVRIRGLFLGQTIRIDDLVDDQKRLAGSTFLNLLFWSFLALFADVAWTSASCRLRMPTLSTLWHCRFGPPGLRIHFPF